MEKRKIPRFSGTDGMGCCGWVGVCGWMDGRSRLMRVLLVGYLVVVVVVVVVSGGVEW